MEKPNCSVADCVKPSVKRGMCNAHYQRVRKHGDPHHGVRPSRLECEIANCDRPSRSRYAGVCEMHYYRERRHGDPLAVRPITGRSTTENGYVVVYQPGHPLARSDGWVLEHRVVLFAAIGPGWHDCHWCSTKVAWHRQYPRHLDALVVDHVDCDKTNNLEANLVPSCFACNLSREASACVAVDVTLRDGDAARGRTCREGGG